MSKIVVLLAVVAATLAKLQNVTVRIDEVTCDGEDYLDTLKIQVWDKDILKDDFLGEMYFNVTNPPQNISLTATENEFLTFAPYLILQHSCNGTCVRSRLDIPSEYVGSTYQKDRLDLNSTFNDNKPC
ncbi:unnamed protein product [Cylicocyclus nassatus]|uniref:Transthyretin-like family protein n=1 Tax=Cylicocyclus nassatus TaxID=53992 RepID=A0AA36H271_CYLNA|nr:unnamed protein product [Cylicocyclus nassatus]